MTVNVNRINRILINSINGYNFTTFSSIIRAGNLDSKTIEDVRVHIQYKLDFSIRNIDYYASMHDVGKTTMIVSFSITIPAMLVDYHPSWMIVPYLTSIWGYGAWIYGEAQNKHANNDFDTICMIKNEFDTYYPFKDKHINE